MAQGTSRPALISRLRREGRDDLADAVEAGRISAHAVAVELGWVHPIRRGTGGRGSGNQGRRIRHRLDAVLREAGVDVVRDREQPANPLLERLAEQIPCISCQHAASDRALAEIISGWAAARRGVPVPRAVDILPAACCRRRDGGPFDPAVLVA